MDPNTFSDREVARVHDMREKVAYLQGLAEGLDLDETTREGRVIHSIIDVLDDFALHMEDVVEAQNELAEYLEDVDSDLTELEHVHLLEGEDEDEAQEMLRDGDELCCEVIACPECGETIGLVDDGDEEADAHECPTCGVTLVT